MSCGCPSVSLTARWVGIIFRLRTGFVFCTFVKVEMTQLLMEGLSQSQTNHKTHLIAFVEAQVSFYKLNIFHHLPPCTGAILCSGTHGHAGPQQAAGEVSIAQWASHWHAPVFGPGSFACAT